MKSFRMYASFVVFCLLSGLLMFGQTAPTPAPAAPPPVQPPALTHEQKLLLDWPNLARYHDADQQLPAPAPGENRVVFFGDSITDAWHLNEFFPGKPYVNRGISGQTTPQMLIRFRPDVIALKPAAVLILAGTNDIAGNTGPTTLQAIEDNFTSMAELARVNGIQAILCSVLPAVAYPWRPGVQPAEKIMALNAWLKSYAEQHQLIYLDYFSALQDDQHGMKAGLSRDGVHPTPAGYAIMQKLAEQAIAQALAKKSS